jgi:hypothetical protein
MYECVMVDNIHESIYDMCESIYDNMCYCDSNYNNDSVFLIQDMINFIEDRMGTISKYDMNTMLVCYGIDKAAMEYNNYYGLENIHIAEFSKSLLTFLIILSFKVKRIDIPELTQ